MSVFYHFLPALHHQWLLAGETGTSGGSMSATRAGVGSAERIFRQTQGEEKRAKPGGGEESAPSTTLKGFFFKARSVNSH